MTDEQLAEKAMLKFFAKHSSIYAIDGKRKAELILRTHEIVSAWRVSRTRPNLYTQRDRWPLVKKHAKALRESLEALSRDIGDDFDHILAGRIGEAFDSNNLIGLLEHVEARAERLVKNFSGKASDKRKDKFVAMACAEAWSIATGRRASSNQEKSPFYLFLQEVYQAYELIGDEQKRLDAPSHITLQKWLPKQT